MKSEIIRILREMMLDEQDFMYEKTQQKIREILNECADGKYVFRGENRHHEKVSSKLYREYDTAPFVDDHILESEKITVNEARCHIRPDALDLEVLTELQHYGGKTTLIDFTRNLFIALFFACERYPDKASRVILLDTAELKEKEYTEAGKIDSEGGYEILRPAGRNTRAVFQSSIFVRACKGYIEKDRFKEIRIEEGLKDEILSYLERYHGINRDTIYNDLHGFIENRRNSYVQQAYYDKRIKEEESAESYFARGTARLASNRLREAIQDFDKAIRFRPPAFQSTSSKRCG